MHKYNWIQLKYIEICVYNIYIYIAREFPSVAESSGFEKHSPSHRKPARTLCSARRSNNSGSTWSVEFYGNKLEISRIHSWKSRDIDFFWPFRGENEKKPRAIEIFSTNETCFPYQKSIQRMEKGENWWSYHVPYVFRYHDIQMYSIETYQKRPKYKRSDLVRNEAQRPLREVTSEKDHNNNNDNNNNTLW